MWQRYLHLGTHDSILSLTHERFHLKEQEISKWQTISGEIRCGWPILAGLAAMVFFVPNLEYWVTLPFGGVACTLIIILGMLFVHLVIKPPKNPQELWSMDGDLPLTRTQVQVENVA
jgi:hypothetical protein